MPRPNLGLIGKQVIVTSPGSPGQVWGGTLVALADHPTLILEMAGGTRVSLPQTCTVMADEFPVVPLVPAPPSLYADRPEGHLATAVNAATHPGSHLPDSWSPPPEPPQETLPECESVLWLRVTIEGDKTAAEAVADPAEISMGAEYVDNCGSDEAAEHIRRHDTQDTIARCEAELKLLDMHGPNRHGNCRACDPDSCGCTGSEDYPCATVRTILSGYRHREGFKPEWVSA